MTRFSGILYNNPKPTDVCSVGFGFRIIKEHRPPEGQYH